MQWQDLVFSTGNIVFALALLPSILSSNKPALTTSLLTGSVLVVFAAAFISLELWLSTGSVILSAAMWFVLAYQKYRSR